MGNQQGKQRGHYGRYIDWERAERPTPPGKPYLSPDSADLPDLIKIRWAPSEYDGGAPIIGYLVEHRRTGSPHWLRAVPHLAEETELLLTGLEPGWRYQFRVSAENDIGRSDPSEVSDPLTVLLQRSAASAPHFNRELHDLVALENDTVELKVHIVGTPAPQIAWFKDGFELFSNRRAKIVTENESSSLIIYQAAVEDEGEIKCTATNRAGHAVTKANLRLQAPPRIRLPRQYEEGLIYERGEVMRLKVTTAGRPPPSVTWYHDGEALITAGRVEVVSTEYGSSVKIRDACREDRGEYSIHGENYIGEDVVSFLVTITDRPGSPNRPQVVMTLGKTVTLSWEEPEDDGGCKIGSYIVEYFRLGWDMWLKAATSRQLTTQLSDLIEGSQYKFRVKAENPYGVSDPSPESDVIFIPDAKRGIVTPPPIQPAQAWVASVEEDSRKRQIADETETEATKRRRRIEENARRLLDSGHVSDVSDEPEISEKRKRLEEDSRRLLDTPLDVLLSNTVDTKEPPRRKKRDSRSPSVSPEPFSGAPPVPKRRAKLKEEMPFSSGLPVTAATTQKGGIPQASITHGTPMPVHHDTAASANKSGTPSTDRPPASITNGTPLPARPYILSPPMSPALLRDDSITHGSSELMLVLYPEAKPLSPQHRSEIELSLLQPAVPPPLSLSSPELGAGEMFEMPPLRNAVSSTELLHERAMARLYQDAAEEEMLKAQLRRKSLERRPSLRETGVERKLSFKETLERRSSFRETAVERKESFHEAVEKNTEESRQVPVKPTRREPKLERMSSEEKEQLEFAKIRERLRLKNEGLKPPESPRVRPPNLKQESTMSSQLSSFDGETGSEHYEGEVEDVSAGDDEDYGEEAMEEEEEEELVEEFMQRLREEVKDSKAMKEKQRAAVAPAVPIHGILKKSEGKRSEEDTYHPRSMVPTRSEVKEIEIIQPVVPAITFNDENTPEKIEVEPEEPMNVAVVPPSPVPKRRSKLLTKIGFGRKKDKKSNENPSTSIVPALSVVLPKPILKKKPAKKKEKKDKNAESESPSPDRTTEKKQVRISEPGSGGLAVPTTDDPKLSPLTKARNQRIQRRQQSIEEEEQANKIIINHYSDIVKEFGGPRKPPPKLYLDLQELEAHAPIEEPAPEIAVGGSDQEERGSAPDMTEVDMGSLLDVAEFVEPPEEDEEVLVVDPPETEEEPEKESLEPDGEPDRAHSPSPAPSHTSNPEEAVRDTMDYLTDVAIVLFAFWLYLFKSEVYVIPVLVLLVYRNLQHTVSQKYRAVRRTIADKIPQKFLNQNKDDDE